MKLFCNFGFAYIEMLGYNNYFNIFLCLLPNNLEKSAVMVSSFFSLPHLCIGKCMWC